MQSPTHVYSDVCAAEINCIYLFFGQLFIHFYFSYSTSYCLNGCNFLLVRNDSVLTLLPKFLLFRNLSHNVIYANIKGTIFTYQYYTMQKIPPLVFLTVVLPNICRCKAKICINICKSMFKWTKDNLAKGNDCNGSTIKAFGIISQYQ